MIAMAVIGAFVLVAFGPSVALGIKRRQVAAERRRLGEWREFHRRITDADTCMVTRMYNVHSREECPRCRSPKLEPAPREALHREGEYR